MHDGKALQSGTSHNFGDGFAKAFGIQYTDKDNTLKYVHQTSWGMTTRLIGAIIMVHGDNDGLVLPPKIAPTQVMVIPIQQQKEGVLDKANEVQRTLWEKSAVQNWTIPIRVRDGNSLSRRCAVFRFVWNWDRRISRQISAVVVRRDTREKIEVALDELEEKVPEHLGDDPERYVSSAQRQHRDAHIWDAHNYDEFKDIAENKPGFIRRHVVRRIRHARTRSRKNSAVTSTMYAV